LKNWVTIYCNPIQNDAKFTWIKIIRIISWIFLNVVFFYMAYAVIVNKIDKYVWIGIALFFAKVIVMLTF